MARGCRALGIYTRAPPHVRPPDLPPQSNDRTGAAPSSDTAQQWLEAQAPERSTTVAARMPHFEQESERQPRQSLSTRAQECGNRAERRHSGALRGRASGRRLEVEQTLGVRTQTHQSRSCRLMTKSTRTASPSFRTVLVLATTAAGRHDRPVNNTSLERHQRESCRRRTMRFP